MEIRLVRRSWSSPITSDYAQLSPWPVAANKGLSYPAHPRTVEGIIAVMRAAGDGPDGRAEGS